MYHYLKINIFSSGEKVKCLASLSFDFVPGKVKLNIYTKSLLWAYMGKGTNFSIYKSNIGSSFVSVMIKGQYLHLHINCLAQIFKL